MTTRQLTPRDVEWVLGHTVYVPKGTTQSPKWWIPIDEASTYPDGTPLADWRKALAAMGPQAKPSSHIEVELRGLDYTERMPKHWIINMTSGLSHGLRKAKLASFVTMNYYDRAELKLPEVSPQIVKAESDAAFFQCLVVARFMKEEARWPCLLCQPYPDGQRLNILRPELT